MPEKLTDKLVRDAACPGNRSSYTLWDTEVTGFGCIVTKWGSKAFLVRYRIDNRERRLTIGSYPDWPVTTAREQANPSNPWQSG